VNEEEKAVMRALIEFDLRVIYGIHPSYIEFWFRNHSDSLVELYRNGWRYRDGEPWTPSENWKRPYE
jgi:hypothetical protein